MNIARVVCAEAGQAYLEILDVCTHTVSLLLCEVVEENLQILGKRALGVDDANSARDSNIMQSNHVMAAGCMRGCKRATKDWTSRHVPLWYPKRRQAVRPCREGQEMHDLN